MIIGVVYLKKVGNFLISILLVFGYLGLIIYMGLYSNMVSNDSNFVINYLVDAMDNTSDIKIVDNYNFDNVYYPYYSFLNDNEKKIYKQVYDNAIKLSTTFKPVIKVSLDEVSNSIEAVYNDHPELFWLETSYSYKYNINLECVQIVLKFNETVNDIERSKALFYGKVRDIVNGALEYDSDYDKEKYVHDVLINMVEYDSSANYNQSAYSAIVDGRTVCAGYARAFQYIMIELKIPVYYCTGYGEGEHAWNIIKLGSNYYNVDVTWDDKSEYNYEYFNKSDREFMRTHTRSEVSDYLPSCDYDYFEYWELGYDYAEYYNTLNNYVY